MIVVGVAIRDSRSTMSWSNNVFQLQEMEAATRALMMESRRLVMASQ